MTQVHQGSDFQALLSEGVQGRVEFDVCGSRLNGSKLEKSSKTYSKDHRLHWKVTSPMPKVVVSGVCMAAPMSKVVCGSSHAQSGGKWCVWQLPCLKWCVAGPMPKMVVSGVCGKWCVRQLPCLKWW